MSQYEISDNGMLRDIEPLLPGNDPPFRDLNDLKNILDLPNIDSTSGQSSTLEVVVTIWTRFKSIKKNAENGDLVIEVESKGNVDNEVSISIIPSDSDTSHRQSIKLTSFKEHTSDEGFSGSFSFNLKNHCGPIDFIMTRKEKWISSRLEGLPELKTIIHQSLDPSFEKLLKLLSGKDSAQFEMAIAWLLNLCGFTAIHCGAKKILERVPDILIFTPFNHILVGECSIELPGTDKVNKLTTRKNEIYHCIRNIYTRMNVAEIIFTPQPSSSVSRGTYQNSFGNTIPVVTSEDYIKIIEMIDKGTAMEKIFQYLMSCPGYLD